MFLKKNIPSLYKEFIYGGHLLSLGASGIILTIIIVLNIPFNIIVLIIPYLSSQVIYSYNHFRELYFDLDSNPERSKHIEKQKKWVSVLPLGYISLLITSLLFTNLSTFLFISFIVSAGILYTDYFKKMPVKYVIGFKNVYTSLFWATCYGF